MGRVIGSNVDPLNPYFVDLANAVPYDPARAKKLLAEAGYPNGFEVKLNCPNDRYVNDGPICQAVAANLARVGVKINLEIETKGTYFPKILRRDTSFYMLGWSASTVDAQNVMYNIMSSPGEGGRGLFNLGAYSNPKFDELTEKIGSETDDKKRNEMIREALKIHQDDIGHIPVHQQTLSWATKKNIELVQLPTPPGGLLTFQSQNLSRVRNYGWEFEAHLPLGPVQVGGTFSITNSTVQGLPAAYTGDYQVGDQVLNVPHTSGGITATYALPRTTFSAGVTYANSWVNLDQVRYYDDLYVNQVFTNPYRSYWITYPAFARVRLSASHQFTPWLNVFAQVENLTNRQLGEVDNFNITAGRTTTIGVRVRS